MAGITLDDDAIEEILYLARANETSELESYLSELSTQTKHGKATLVSAAIDPYSRNSALHYAAANGHADVIKLLLSYNLDKVTTSAPQPINAVNDAGNTPLHWAALNGQLESVKLLIQLGADVTIINKAGHDALFEAEINDKKEVVEWLLGAVEELEAGIGQTGDPSSNGAGDEMEVELEADSKRSCDDNGDGAAVQGITRQMDGMKTSASPQGG
ncbi:ankyrin repeat-containing protein YAR1 [Lophiotrema nucula]|uniref:Ankyrin repeat-containing protein YAR1 n=1 Tax=Lophiotrema nucula TaxID=690887 RepID=A0A6A5Z3H3_9PLEO|nr:ankyrin repeat-containing protein YAR1 [Lophiotrema nucula]